MSKLVLLKSPIKQISLAFAALVCLTGVVFGESSDSFYLSSCYGDWGSAGSSYRGITAYSNGSNPNCADYYGDYGYMYQCVEYVNRFYTLAIGWQNMRGTGNGVDYYDRRNQGLTSYANGGSTPPMPDDIISFRGGTQGYGHVAIVTYVGDDSISVIEQNWSINSTRRTLSLTKHQSDLGTRTYIVNSGNSAYSVQGWARPNKLLIRARNDSRVFWLQNGKLYHVENADILNKMSGVRGWGWDQIKVLPQSSALFSYSKPGSFIKSDGGSNGMLIRQAGTNDVYKISGNRLLHVNLSECLSINCWEDVIDVSASLIDRFRTENSKTPPRQSNSIPVITGVSIPSAVYGTAEWYVHFSDSDANVNLVRSEELSDGYWSNVGSWNPNVAGYTSGSIFVRTSCYRVGSSQKRVILRDGMGNESAPYRYTLNCRSAVSRSASVDDYSTYEHPLEKRTSDVFKHSIIQRKHGIVFSQNEKQQSAIQISVYGIDGQLIFKSNSTPRNSVTWRLKDFAGNQIPNGVYIYVLSIKDFRGNVSYSLPKKIVVMR